MGQLFGNLSTEGLEESQDRLGGFRVRESDAYLGTIKMLYAGKAAKSNAQSFTLVMDMDDGTEYKETFWATDKEGKNWYPSKKDPKKKEPLPGFTAVDDICLVTTNKPLAQQNVEDKMVNVYDPDQKKEVPKSVPMLVEVLGKQVRLGILKEVKNKQKQNDAGVYVDTPETREENVTDKVFHHPSNLTVVEARNQIQAPAFYGSWIEKNKGQTRDRTNKQLAGQGGTAGRPGMPPKAGDTQAQTKSLF